MCGENRDDFRRGRKVSERFGFKRNGGWQEENSARLYKTSKPLNAFFRKKSCGFAAVGIAFYRRYT